MGENFQQIANAQNRIDGWCYDNAGSLLHQGACGPVDQTYDAESRITSAGGVTHGYDGDRQRIYKSTGTLYFGSGPLVETDSAGTIKHEFVFFGGKRIARRDGVNGAVHFYFTDHLGSASMVTDVVGTMSNCTGPDNVVRSSGEDESDYYPWGGERVLCDRLADQDFKFTGKERDTETGFDYFGARYYANAQGRWLTPDWADKPTSVPYAEFGDPQSLNLYVYVRNNPLNKADPEGHEADGFGDATKRSVSYLAEEVKGVADTTIVAAAQLTNQIATGEAGQNMITTATLAISSPGAIGVALREGSSQFVAVNQAASNGDGRAMGQLVGIVATLFAGGIDRPEPGVPIKGITFNTDQVPQVRTNQAIGNAWRDEVASSLRESGASVKTEVYKATPFGARRVDIDVARGGRTLGGVEAKAGDSPYRAPQRAKDWWLKQSGYPVNVVRKPKG